MFKPTLKLFSRYVSTVESKRQYHSSRACVDVAGRDSCRFNTIGCWLFLYWCSEDLNKQFSSIESEPLSPPSAHKPGPFCSSAATLARFFHIEISCRWLVGESNNKFARHIFISEMNYPPSLKLHDATLADQEGGVLKITRQYDTEPRIDWKKNFMGEGHVWGIRSLRSFSLAILSCGL